MREVSDLRFTILGPHYTQDHRVNHQGWRQDEDCEKKVDINFPHGPIHGPSRAQGVGQLRSNPNLTLDPFRIEFNPGLNPNTKRNQGLGFERVVFADHDCDRHLHEILDQHHREPR